jgi:hypothetical protein
MPPSTVPAPDDLNEAERFLVLAAGRGEPADLKRHTVRASVVRDLILEARQGWTVREAGIRIQKAIIDGCLDLEGCEIGKPLLFWHSRLQGGGDRGALLLRDAKLKRLGIHSCTIEGSIIADRSEIENGIFLGGGLIKGLVQIRGSDVGGALAIEGTEIGDGKSALLAAGIRLTGPLILRRAKVKGEIAFPRGELGAGIYAEDAVISKEGVAINGESARVTGDLLFDRANITGSIKLNNARIGGQISADGLIVAATPNAIIAGGINVAQGINLSNARIAGSVWLEGADVGKMFRAEAAEIWGGETAIGADVIRIGGNWNLARSKLVGQLVCPGAEINGQLRLTEARLFGTDIAVRADGARIRGGCFLSRATVLGLLRFPAVEIGNQFRLRGATLRVDRGAALLASGSTFNRDVELNGGLQTTGALIFDQARIRGACDLSGSRLVSVALSPESRTAPAAAGAQEDTNDKLNDIALSLVDAKIGRLELPAKAEERPLGIVDLSRASVGSFTDYAATWPPGPGLRGRSRDGRDIDHLVLDGFTYEHLGNPAGAEIKAGAPADRDARVGARRVLWLEAQEGRDLSDHFKPQAWMQLAHRLSAQGYHNDARTITIARRRREGRSHSTTAGQRWQGRILDLFALYGLNPWRTVVWMALIIVAFASIWSWAAGQCREAGCLDESVFVVSNRDAYTQEAFARSYPEFNALAYSLDVFVPFVSFGYEDHWRPNIRWEPIGDVTVPNLAALVPGASGQGSAEPWASLKVTWGGLLYGLGVVEMIIGLVLTSLAVTGFTGLLRGEE